jgi:hypothetical protein
MQGIFSVRLFVKKTLPGFVPRTFFTKPVRVLSFPRRPGRVMSSELTEINNFSYSRLRGNDKKTLNFSGPIPACAGMTNNFVVCQKKRY